MKPPPKIIVISERIYRAFLCLYPKSHRSEFEEPMAQLFRDQCRDAWQARRFAGVLSLWLRTLPDIGKSLATEQIDAIERSPIMKNLITKHSPTILLVAGLAMALLSLSPLVLQARFIFLLLLTTSSLAILAKAGIELFRPGNEWKWILFRTFVLMFCYALILPAWAKIKLGLGMQPGAHDPVSFFILINLLANPAVTAIKIVQFLVQRRHVR